MTAQPATPPPHLTPVPPPVPSPAAEMTLIEHQKELRNRAIICAIALVIGTAVCFYFWETIFGWLLAPARKEIPDFTTSSFSPLDRIGVVFKIGLYGGLILASPVFIFHLLRFVTPGLTSRERRLLYPGLLGVIAFLLAGMAFAYYVILPRSLGFLLGLGETQIEEQQGVKAYTDFVVRIIFWVGVSFELPMVMAILSRLGMVRAKQLWHGWRYAFVGVFVVAAVITPTPDPLTQAMVAGPMFVLYIAGIGMAWLARPRRRALAPA